MTKFIFNYLLLVILCSNSQATLRSFSATDYFQARDRSDSHDDTVNNNNVETDVEELFLEQRLDHFESYPSDEFPFTFSQRYFYTARYVTSNTNNTPNRKHLRQEESPTASPSEAPSSSPTPTLVFVCMGGEGPSLSKSVLIDSVHCTGDMLKLASILHRERGYDVHVFALEHRYYGSSYPKFHNDSSPVSNTALRFLSSRQALSDLAYFVHQSRITYKFAEDVKWITFGGSYPGMLAAWARLKYPHLIYAAVSNSAPLQVTLDFGRYKEVVGEDLRNVDIGGSDKCFDVVTRGHEEISLLLSNDVEDGHGREQVATMFNVCGGADSLRIERNRQLFLGDGVIDIPAQGNDPNCSTDMCNIEKICANLTSSDDSPAVTLAKVSRFQSPSCKNIDWSEMIDFLSSEKAQTEGIRSWLWQTCTEVGFYQTCRFNSTCPFGKGLHNLDLDLEICQKAFGIDAEFVERNVQDTLDYYGGWNMKGTRILSVNGDVDPWSALSLNVKKDFHDDDYDKVQLPTYWSRGASHHFWTHEVSKSDGIGIMETREIIYEWFINLIDGAEKELLKTYASFHNSPPLMQE